MNARAKFLFDENIGRPIVSDLKSLLKWAPPDHDIIHLDEFMGWSGEEDAVWVPKAADEGWTVITADLGKSPGLPLPLICRRNRLTHILFKGELHDRRQFEKARAVVFLWHDIVEASRSPAGSRFLIRARSNSFILHKCA